MDGGGHERRVLTQQCGHAHRNVHVCHMLLSADLAGIPGRRERVRRGSRWGAVLMHVGNQTNNVDDNDDDDGEDDDIKGERPSVHRKPRARQAEGVAGGVQSARLHFPKGMIACQAPGVHGGIHSKRYDIS